MTGSSVATRSRAEDSSERDIAAQAGWRWYWALSQGGSGGNLVWVMCLQALAYAFLADIMLTGKKSKDMNPCETCCVQLSSDHQHPLRWALGRRLDQISGGQATVTGTGVGGTEVRGTIAV